MNSEPSYQMHRASKYLVTCLAALVTVSVPSLRAAETADAKAPVSVTPVPASALSTDEGVQVLSPFQVKADKDSGYLRTNAVTAARIGAEIQVTPLAIVVRSKDFLDDTNTQTINDIFRYTASGQGDNAFRMTRPANGPTPQGGMTLRGFQVTSLLRNGVTLYSGWTNNNVERVEIVMGPAALFFGSGAPGGVINYITKQPVFARIPTTVDYITGSDHKKKVVVDVNQMLSKKAAIRVVGAWEDSGGDRRWEYDHNREVSTSLTLLPFDSGKLKITFEAIFQQETFNENRFDMWHPQGWFDAYDQSLNVATNGVGSNVAALEAAAGIANPGSAAAATALQARYFTNGFGAWGVDMRVATQNFTTPTMTRVVQGALYKNAAGTVIQDKAFNTTARGAKTILDNNDVYFTVETSPFEFMDFRYQLSSLHDRYDSIEGINYANADNRTFNDTLSLAAAGYYRKIQDHQFDLVLKKDFWGMKHKVLVGGFFREFFQQYQANAAGIFGPFYGLTPGASNLIANPANGAWPLGYGFTGGLSGAQLTGNQVPVNQVIRDRFGVIKTVQQIHTQFDPGFEIAPEISTLVEVYRNALDGYYAQDQGGYINYLGTAFDDRLTIMAGVRREMHRDSGQYLTNNFPWFAPPPSAYYDTATYLPSVYGYDPGYAGDRDGLHSRIAGTSYMVGLSFAVKKDVNVYVSSSKIFNRAGATNAGSFSTLNVPIWYAAMVNYRAAVVAAGLPSLGPIVYNGDTINSTTDLLNALHKNGADVLIPPETGKNVEIGVKTSLWDSKLVATVSLFHMFRVNRRVEDGAKNAIEPLDGVNNQVYFGNGTINGLPYSNPAGNFQNARLLRWRFVGQRDEITGVDFEATWTPRRNFQMIVNGANLWQAKTVENPLINKPGSALYNALDLTTNAGKVSKVNSDIHYGARLENIPKYKFNTWSKYTFTDGGAAGLSLALGTRYTSQTVISRSVDWNPLNGGATAGDYFVFDCSVSYPWEVLGYKIVTSANVTNLTNKAYLDGSSQTYAAGRTFILHNTLKF